MVCYGPICSQVVAAAVTPARTGRWMPRRLSENVILSLGYAPQITAHSWFAVLLAWHLSYRRTLGVVDG